MKEKLHPFPELISDRLRLRQLNENDLPFLEEIMQFGKSVEGMTAEQLVFLSESKRKEGQAITWALDLNGEMIGTCGFYRGFQHQTGEIGFVMREAHRRKGFMKEACRSVMMFGFDSLGLQRITAYTKENNLPSIATIRSLGFNMTDEENDDYLVFELVRKV